MSVPEQAKRIGAGLKSFKEEMREQGIHVGMGMKPYCVTCDEPWPCRIESKARADAEATEA